MGTLERIQLFQKFVTIVQIVSLPLVLCMASTPFEMIPSGKTRVVSEGNFNITCRFVLPNYWGKKNGPYDGNITWTLPNIYTNHTITPLAIKEDDEDLRTNLTLTSTLTVFNATSKGTGYYSCVYTGNNIKMFIFDEMNRTQYIYVKGEDLLTVATHKITEYNDRVEMAANKGTDVIIPCKATQPSVNISVSRRKFSSQFLVAELTVLQQMKDQILFDGIQQSTTNSKFTYDYHHGLTIRNVRGSDSGLYMFRGSLNNMTSEITIHLLVAGIDLEMVGEVDEVEEGSNVTLLCTHYPKTQPTIRWRYGKNKIENLSEFNKTHPPIGIESSQFHMSSYTQKFQFYHILQLFNVTRKFYNNYECEGWRGFYDSRNNTSNRLSLRFKSREKDREVKQIIMGERTSILCTAENATDFKWFKNKQQFDISGQQANQLTFDGVTNDAGLYECIYLDEFGDQRQRAFDVTVLKNS